MRVPLVRSLIGLASMTLASCASSPPPPLMTTVDASPVVASSRPHETQSESPVLHAAKPEARAADRDGDRVLDDVDVCPDTRGLPENDGCPKRIVTGGPDRDRDRVLDANDMCPDEPEDQDGFQDQDGCPDPDNDGDGIPDPQDKCPNTPETKNGFQDADGCPDTKPSHP